MPAEGARPPARALPKVRWVPHPMKTVTRNISSIYEFSGPGSERIKIRQRNLIGNSTVRHSKPLQFPIKYLNFTFDYHF